jgi:hypothetical protein
LRIFVSTAVASIGDAWPARSSAFISKAGLWRKGRPGYNLDAHIKARFAPDDKQNSQSDLYFAGRVLGKLWSNSE